MIRPRVGAADLSLGGGCIVLALAAIFVARDYGFGDLAAMGPGFLPITLSVLLGFVGILIVLGVGRDPDEASDATDTQAQPETTPLIATREVGRVLLGVLGSVLLFGLTVQRLGLALSILLLVLIAGAARKGAKPLETLLLALAISIFCSVVFVVLLGIRLPVFPL